MKRTKRLIALSPLIAFTLWVMIGKPEGAIILVAFFIAFMCTIGLGQILEVIREINPEEKGDHE